LSRRFPNTQTAVENLLRPPADTDFVTVLDRGACAVASAVAMFAVVSCSTPAPSPHPAAPPASTLAAGDLDRILLTVPEANTVMATEHMEISAPTYRGTYTKNLETMANPDCLSTDSPGLDPVYRGSGYTALSTQTMVGFGKDYLRQAVASFPSSDMGHAFVDKLSRKWKACAGQTITAQTIPTSGGIYTDHTYTLGSVVSTGPSITQSRTGSYAECQRALEAVANLVIDVDACSTPPNDQGRRAADALASKAATATGRG
jgi:PknH-like protein